MLPLRLKTLAFSLVLACCLAAGACSRSSDTAAASPTPRPNLKSDADRLQQAINKAAEQRKQDAGSPAASPTP